MKENTIEYYTTYLSENQDIINISRVAELINMDVGNLHRAINGKKCKKGYISKIPERCLTDLQKLFETRCWGIE